MGVKGLHKLLRDTCPQVFIASNLSAFRDSLIAVDASLYLYKFIATSGSYEWIRRFISMISTLQKYQIKPIFIFDGEAPVEKEWEWQRRNARQDAVNRRLKDLQSAVSSCFQENLSSEESAKTLQILNAHLESIGKKNLLVNVQLESLEEAHHHMELFHERIEHIERQIVHISESNIEDLQELLSLFGLPYFEAETEGETLAAHLAVHRRVSAVLSDDSDLMVYGTPVYISNLELQSGTCTVVRHVDVLRGLGLTHDQFVDLCILCGTDYNPNIPQIGPKRGYQLIQAFGSLEEIEGDGYETDCLNYDRGRELFSVPKTLDLKVDSLQPPAWQEIRSFCHAHRCPINIDSLRRLWNPIPIHFAD